MSNVEQPKVDLAVLSRLKAAVGESFLAYMLSCSVDAICAMTAGTVVASGKQSDAIKQVAAVLRTVPPELDTATASDVIRSWLTAAQDDGVSTVRKIRESINGPEALIDTEDELERAIAALAVDAYPTFLLPPDDRLPRELLSIHTTVHISSHKEKEKFTNAALSDAVLGQVFVKETEHTGWSGVLYANTGTGGGLQLSMLAEVLLRSAWRNLGGEHSSQTFATRAVEELTFARAVLSGESRTILVRVALAGIRLPNGERLELGNGDVVRSVEDSDWRLVSIPEDIKGRLSSTDSSGNSATIHYEGDLLLVHRFPYRVRIGEPDDDGGDPWFEDPIPHSELEGVIRRLRISLVLATQREHRVQIVESWRYFDQPLSQGWSMSHGDPRRSADLRATQLGPTEVAAWKKWYERLSKPDAKRIELAVTRVLRAVSERRDPSDVLIDSVIAWETLFGTPQGEPTFRVSASMAVLLADSYESRKALKKDLASIYNLRSKVVHGNRNLNRDEYPKCHKALEYAIRAIRKLVEERTDILALGDGGQRGEALLLGATVSESEP